MRSRFARNIFRHGWRARAKVHVGRGVRYQKKLGKGITRHVAWELAQVARGAILKGEAGIRRKKNDLSFDEARKKFEAWATASKKPSTANTYKECLRRLAESFSGMRLSEMSPFLIEKHKQGRIQAGARVRSNRELGTLKNLFNRCREWELFEGDNPAAAVKPSRSLDSAFDFSNRKKKTGCLMLPKNHCGPSSWSVSTPDSGSAQKP